VVGFAVHSFGTRAPAAWTAPAHASSHREAPLITLKPKLDGTDFRSHEPDRDTFITLIANYLLLQDPYSGLN
jgi:hypothetical protein